MMEMETEEFYDPQGVDPRDVAAARIQRAVRRRQAQSRRIRETVSQMAMAEPQPMDIDVDELSRQLDQLEIQPRDPPRPGYGTRVGRTVAGYGARALTGAVRYGARVARRAAVITTEELLRQTLRFAISQARGMRQNVANIGLGAAEVGSGNVFGGATRVAAASANILAETAASAGMIPEFVADWAGYATQAIPIIAAGAQMAGRAYNVLRNLRG